MHQRLYGFLRSVFRAVPRYALPKFILMWRNMSVFERVHGYRFDIDHPRTFNEKLQWYKFNYFDARMLECVDKLGFKDFARERLGEDFSPKTLGIWTDIDALEKDWDSLPERFCLKSNCMGSSLGVLIITNKSDVSFDAIKPRVRSWLKKKNTSVNSTYKVCRHVKPNIFAEEYIGQNDSLCDYKFYCFDGKPYCANATIRHFRHGKILDGGIAFYDRDWNVLRGNVAGRTCTVVEKPARLDEMLEIAGKLSEGFPFIRVDLYYVDSRIYTGETEFYPGGGFGKYEPYEFDLEMGEQFVLPRKK